MSDDELERLRRRLEDQHFAEELSDALMVASATGTIGSPVKHEELLRSIVETAAAVIGADAGALFLIDEDSGELFFEIAIGPAAESVKHLRVPMGSGVAGLVAATGQAMAVADASQDPTVFEAIGERVGYRPENLLCVPLFHSDRVIGALELVNKTDGTTFTPTDMETLALFGSQAANAIQISRAYRSIVPLLAELVATIGDGAADRRASLLGRARSFADRVEFDPEFRWALNLALQVQDIAWRGDEEAAAVSGILSSFATYLRARDGEPE